MRLTKTTARDILRRVEGGECFFNADGSVFSGLEEFDEALSRMPQDAFNNHCNSQKCDFASWIEEILHDAVLAKDIRRANGVRAKIEARISERLEQLAKYR